MAAAQTVSNNPNTFDLPLNLIEVDKKQNSRSVMDKDAITELAESIKREGQLMAVKVIKKDNGKFDLVFGFRRHAAISQLRATAKKDTEWTTIRAEVVEALDPVARKLQNLTENLAREGLSTFDQASSFLDLKQTHDMSGDRIASHVGKSKSYVNNLIRCMEGVNDDILARWEEESRPEFGYDKEGKRIATTVIVCTNDWLQKLVARVPKAEQTLELQRALGLVDDGNNDEEGDEEDEEGRGSRGVGSKRATLSQLKKCAAAIDDKLKEGAGTKEQIAELKAYKTAIKYAMGDTQGIKGVFTNPKPGEA